MKAAELARRIVELARCAHEDRHTLDVSWRFVSSPAPPGHVPDRWCVRCGAYRVADGAWKRPYLLEDLAGFVSGAGALRAPPRPPASR